jgi:hypothetical protein
MRVSDGFLLTKGVDDPTHPPGRVDHQHIEPYAGHAPIRMVSKDNVGGGQQTRALSWCERRGSVCQLGARLHLDEGEQTVAFGDNIHLARRGAQTALPHCPAIRLQRGTCGGFRIQAARMGDAASLATLRHHGRMRNKG